MTPERFRACLAALRWSQRGVAEHLGLHTTTVRRWATGEGVIPETVARWLEHLAVVHQAMPMPENWHAEAAA